ncbi:MAG: CPXCG motif-containing cysteine-rich protein [bacterium]
MCGSPNESLVDPALGATQKFTEDCAVCCRPNLLRVTVDADGDVLVTAEFDE